MLTLAQIAARLQVAGHTVRRWYTAGVMPAPMKIARRLRWEEKTINEWIENGCPRVEKLETFSPNPTATEEPQTC